MDTRTSIEPSICNGTEFVVTTTSPKILVLSTPAADQLANQNGLATFCDFIKPFGHNVVVNYRVNDGEGNMFNLEEITVRFYQEKDELAATPSMAELTSATPAITPVTPAVGASSRRHHPIKPNDKTISRWIGLTKEQVLTLETQDDGKKSRYRHSQEGGITIDTIWYEKFKHNWVASVGQCAQESFAHPIVALFILDISEKNLNEKIKQLYKRPALDRARKSIFNGAEILFFYLFVSDQTKRKTNTADKNAVTVANAAAIDSVGDGNENKDINVEEINNRFNELRKSLGMNTALLRLRNASSFDNSHTAQRRKAEIWAKYRERPSHAFLDENQEQEQQQEQEQENEQNQPSAQEYGGNIDIETVESLRRAVRQVVVQGLIGHLQRQLFVLAEQTNSARNGLAGRLLSVGMKYFGGGGGGGGGGGSKSKMKATDDYGEVYYQKTSVEHKLRKMGDILFMLRGYKQAQNIYAVASREYWADKSIKCYAGAQEMIGLCKILASRMVGAAIEGTEKNGLVAIDNYRKSVWQSEVYTIRTAILYHELYTDAGNHTMAAAILERVAQTTNSTINGVLLEQVSTACMRAGRRRKALLYKQLAGEQFDVGEEYGHSYRCFVQLQGCDRFFEGWSNARAFRNGSMGRLAIRLGKIERGLEYYIHLLNHLTLNTEMQSQYLKETLQLYQRFGTNNSSSDSNDFGGGGSGERSLKTVLNVPEILVDSLRLVVSGDIVEGTDMLMDWGSGGGKAPVGKEDSKRVTCSGGETVTALILVNNQLKVPISLHNITLKYRLYDKEGNEIELVNENENEKDLIESGEIESQVLEPLATSMITIAVRIKPGFVGEVKLVGLEYKLCDVIRAEKSLLLIQSQNNYHEAKQNISANNKKDKSASEMYPSILVKENLPFLGIQIDDFPDVLLHGQVRPFSIKIRNLAIDTAQPNLADTESPLSVGKLCVWTSHPTFLWFNGNDDDVSSGKEGKEEKEEKEGKGVSFGGKQIVLENNVPNHFAHYCSETRPLNLVDLISRNKGKSCGLGPGGTLEICGKFVAQQVGTFVIEMYFGYLSTAQLLNMEKGDENENENGKEKGKGKGKRERMWWVEEKSNIMRTFKYESLPIEIIPSIQVGVELMNEGRILNVKLENLIVQVDGLDKESNRQNGRIRIEELGIVRLLPSSSSSVTGTGTGTAEDGNGNESLDIKSINYFDYPEPNNSRKSMDERRKGICIDSGQKVDLYYKLDKKKKTNNSSGELQGDQTDEFTISRMKEYIRDLVRTPSKKMTRSKSFNHSHHHRQSKGESGNSGGSGSSSSSRGNIHPHITLETNKFIFKNAENEKNKEIVNTNNAKVSSRIEMIKSKFHMLGETATEIFGVFDTLHVDIFVKYSTDNDDDVDVDGGGGGGGGGGRWGVIGVYNVPVGSFKSIFGDKINIGYEYGYDNIKTNGSNSTGGSGGGMMFGDNIVYNKLIERQLDTLNRLERIMLQ